MKLKTFEGQIEINGTPRDVAVRGGEANLTLTIVVASMTEAMALLAVLEGSDAPAPAAAAPAKPVVGAATFEEPKRSKKSAEEKPKVASAQENLAEVEKTKAKEQLSLPTETKPAPTETKAPAVETKPAEPETPKANGETNGAAKPPADEDDAGPVTVPDELAKAGRLVDVIMYLRKHGHTTKDQLVAEIARLRAANVVPVLGRLVGELPERVERALATLG